MWWPDFEGACPYRLRPEPCTSSLSPFTDCPYSSLALKQTLSKLLWGGRRLMVRKQVCHQRLCNRGSGMPVLESHWKIFLVDPWREIQCGDRKWRRPFLAWCSTPRLRGETPFFAECSKTLRNLPWSTDHLRSRNELCLELVVVTTLDQLSRSLNEIRSQWNWPQGSGFMNNSCEFLLTWRIAWHAFPLNSRAFKIGLADMIDWTRCGSGLEKNESTRFGVTSESGRPALILTTSGCLTLVISGMMLILRWKLRNGCCFLGS